MTSRWRAWLSWSWLVTTLVVALPLLRLWPLDGQFVNDWTNHEWLIGYTGEYLRQHGTVPVVVNTTGPVGSVGMPFPIFYGTLFYPVMSILAIWLDPGLAIRLVVVIVGWLQLRTIRGALTRLDVPPWRSTGSPAW